MIRVAVAGAAGKMGQTTCAAVEAASDLELTGRADPALAVSLADVLGDADVVVDFTRPDTVLFTSTLVKGSTVPTSRTLTWRSSAWTLPSRKGRFCSPLPLSPPLAVMRRPPTTATAAVDAMTQRFFIGDPMGKTPYEPDAVPGVRPPSDGV